MGALLLRRLTRAGGGVGEEGEAGALPAPALGPATPQALEPQAPSRLCRPPAHTGSARRWGGCPALLSSGSPFPSPRRTTMPTATSSYGCGNSSAGLPLAHPPSHSLHGALWRTLCFDVISNLWTSCRNCTKSPLSRPVFAVSSLASPCPCTRVCSCTRVHSLSLHTLLNRLGLSSMPLYP